MGDLLPIAIIWVVGALNMALLALTTGRSPLRWFMIAAVASPVLRLMAVLASEPAEGMDNQRRSR